MRTRLVPSGSRTASMRRNDRRCAAAKFVWAKRYLDSPSALTWQLTRPSFELEEAHTKKKTACRRGVKPTHPSCTMLHPKHRRGSATTLLLDRHVEPSNVHVLQQLSPQCPALVHRHRCCPPAPRAAISPDFAIARQVHRMERRSPGAVLAVSAQRSVWKPHVHCCRCCFY